MTDTATAPETHADAHAEFMAKVQHLKCLVNECCDSAPGIAKDGMCQAKEAALKAGHQAVDAVRKHPVQVVAVAGVAIGAGLLVWWLMSRRS